MPFWRFNLRLLFPGEMERFSILLLAILLSSFVNR